MSNIIDFNSGKPKKGPKQETNTPPAGFREMVDAADLLFSDLPQHEMTFDAADAVKRRVSKLMLFAALTAQANEAIRKTGLDPAGFIVDEISLDLFITRDLPHVSQGGITATAGIGTNLYLAKIAMDIVAKHIPADKDGVRIAELDEQSYREKLWSHRPLTDFWRVGHGYAARLEAMGMHTMGDVARMSVKCEDVNPYIEKQTARKIFGGKKV